MNIDDYQTAALSTLVNGNQEHLTYGLAAEVGEVMALMQKAARRDPRYWDDNDHVFLGHYTNLFKEKMFAELGDCLWYLSCLANYHGWSLSSIAKNNLEKLGTRLLNNKIQGDGDFR